MSGFVSQGVLRADSVALEIRNPGISSIIWLPLVILTQQWVACAVGLFLAYDQYEGLQVGLFSRSRNLPDQALQHDVGHIAQPRSFYTLSGRKASAGKSRLSELHRPASKRREICAMRRSID